MKPLIWPATKSTVRVVGLLVLAVVISTVRPVRVQAQLACELPPGATPPAEPRVTAQQVEGGSASLREFALAVKDQFIQGTTTVEEALYIGCRVRQDESPYRSGSTYLVQLTPDGRIFVHAKDMTLSGRQLNPLIYGAILQAVGINPAHLADPVAAFGAFAAAAAGNGGAVNLPSIPGASGYAVVYFSDNFRVPIVVLAGLDLNESHILQEDIDLGAPAVSARDVVDRETLKGFVTEAGNYFVTLQESGDLAAVSKARIALRDPNGPWRHGSVYLYVLDTVSNVILFHGAFPDRFELRPLTPTTRDVVTGEYILTQVIEAAESSPEGGFVQYYFDDPTDATDSADIPKVGYAREFTASLRRADGSVLPLSYIIGSGFYLSAPEVTAVRQNNVLEDVLPQVMRTMTASTVDAISDRIRQAGSRTPPATALSFGGASTLSDAVLVNGRALASGTFDLNRVLAGSSFSVPLDAVETGGSGLMGNLTLWGNADYLDISDSSQQNTTYDGDLRSASLGLDTRLSGNLLGGVSVTHARGTMNYTDTESVTGEFTTTLSSINPYLGWLLPGSASLWAAAGYGRGDVAFDESTGTRTGDLTQRMVAAGLNKALVASEHLIGGGTTSLTIKGETAFTRADVEGDAVLRNTKLSVNRHRVMLEGAYARRLASGATLTPSIESGMRYDGGDGETGAGLEVGAGLGYSTDRLAVKVNARGLLAQNGANEYEEWGFSGLLAFQPRSDGRGLSMLLGSGWGVTQSGVHALWSRRDAGTLARGGAAMNAAQRYHAELRYGMNGLAGRALWLPYVGTESGDDSRALRMGLRLTMDRKLGAGLEIKRKDSVYRSPDHTIEILGNMHF
ncbi:MAG: hypothetical protein OXH02_01385 [Gemmatimonadetes bacterium]|nr:hypothetical protein [Gemmatimonadota bacterium]